MRYNIRNLPIIWPSLIDGRLVYRNRTPASLPSSDQQLELVMQAHEQRKQNFPGNHAVNPDIFWRKLSSFTSRLLPLSVLDDGIFLYERLPFVVREILNTGRMSQSGTITEGYDQDNLGCIDINAPQRVKEEVKKTSIISWRKANDRINQWVTCGAPLTLELIEEANMILRNLDPIKIREFEAIKRERSQLWSDFRIGKITDEKYLLETNEKLCERVSTYARKMRPLYRDRHPTAATSRKGKAADGQFMYAPDMKKALPMISETISNGSLHPIIRASKVYQDLITLHPFIDGNGRTARLVMDGLLMRNGYPPTTGKLPLVANFTRYFIGGEVIYADDPVMLSGVVHAVMKAIKKSCELVAAYGVIYELPNVHIPSDAVMDALTFIP